RLDPAEVLAKAPELRDVAVYHQSEWAAEDWSRLTGPPWKLDEAFVRREAAVIRQLQWWRLAQAVDRRKLLPEQPKLWHYHPIELVRRLQAAYAPGGSQEGAPRGGRELADEVSDEAPGELPPQGDEEPGPAPARTRGAQPARE